MPGSSSTRRILALSLMVLSFARGHSGRFVGNQERKLAACSRLSIHPYFTAHAAHQATRDGQAQSHSFLTFVARKTKKVIENFEMKFRGNSRAGIGNTDLDGVGLGKILAPALGCHSGDIGGAAL